MAEYFKDFDGWNEIKKKIDKKAGFHFCNEGEIWWCSWGVNIDVEIDGKNELFERPVVVIKKFNSRISLVAPLTLSTKDHTHVYKLTSNSSCVSLSNMKSYSNKRLLRKISSITQTEYEHIVIRIKYIFGYKNETPLNRKIER